MMKRVADVEAAQKIPTNRLIKELICQPPRGGRGHRRTVPRSGQARHSPSASAYWRSHSEPFRAASRQGRRLSPS